MRWALLIFLLLIFNIFVWHSVIVLKSFEKPAFYFFEVGQGDSQLIVWPGSVKILIDGGPNNLVVYELEKVLRPGDKYIDLVVLSHANYDHYTGLIDLLDHYQIGVFIDNGRMSEAAAYQKLKEKLTSAGVKMISLAEGDKIKHGRNSAEVLNPPRGVNSMKENDASLVMLTQNEEARALFAGDINREEFRRLARQYDLSAHILKVPHHGSKYSMDDFLAQAISPMIAVVGVGKNRYGHPAPEVIQQLRKVGSSFYRTDEDGTIKILVDREKMTVFRIK